MIFLYDSSWNSLFPSPFSPLSYAHFGNFYPGINRFEFGAAGKADEKNCFDYRRRRSCLGNGDLKSEGLLRTRSPYRITRLDCWSGFLWGFPCFQRHLQWYLSHLPIQKKAGLGSALYLAPVFKGHSSFADAANSGAPYEHTENAGSFTGILPQLLNAITGDEALSFITDPDWCRPKCHARASPPALKNALLYERN
jgi:hypothetical protein